MSVLWDERTMDEWTLDGEFSPGSLCRIGDVVHEIVGIHHVKTKYETGEPAAWISLDYHQWQLKSDEGDKIVFSTRICFPQEYCNRNGNWRLRPENQNDPETEETT